MVDYPAVPADDKHVPRAVHTLGRAEVRDRLFPTVRLVIPHSPLDKRNRVFGRFRICDRQRQGRQNLVPAEAENQPIVQYRPRMLVFLPARGRIEKEGCTYLTNQN